MAKELYDFEAEIIHETDKVWFPKSILEDNGDGTFTCPEKFAIEKEIV